MRIGLRAAVALLLLGSVLLGSGCERACLLMGCFHNLTIEFDGVGLEGGGTYQVRICVDDTCVTDVVTLDQQGGPDFWFGSGENGLNLQKAGWVGSTMLIPNGPSPVDRALPVEEFESRRVSFEVLDASGLIVASVTDRDVLFTNPNGRGCEPTCATALIEA